MAKQRPVRWLRDDVDGDASSGLFDWAVAW